LNRGRHSTAVSEKRRAANRANARASTGPRTPAGKARVARNARRHGLNLPVMDDPALAPQVEALARGICGLGVNAQRQGSALHPEPQPAPYSALRPALEEKLDLARRIAEAEIDLIRVRLARHDLLARALANPNYRSSARLGARIALLRRTGEMLELGIPIPGELRDAILSRPQGAQKFALILADLAGELAAMDRYERRARSRRKFAVRAFDAGRAQGRSLSLPVFGEGRVGQSLQQALRCRESSPSPASGGGLGRGQEDLVNREQNPLPARRNAPRRPAPQAGEGKQSLKTGREKEKNAPRDIQRQPTDQVPVVEATPPSPSAFWQNKATAAGSTASSLSAREIVRLDTAAPPLWRPVTKVVSRNDSHSGLDFLHSPAKVLRC
jgi:hypothetical protein